MNQHFFGSYLTTTQLKEKARNSLTGNLGRFALAFFIIFVLKISIELLTELFAILLYSIYIVCRELVVNRLNIDEFYLLLSDMTAMQPYLDTYQVIDYILSRLTDIFTNVFSVSTTFIALKLACGHSTKLPDIFYGFRYRFGKGLRLSIIFVLLEQLITLPGALLSYLVNQNAVYPLIVAALVLYLVGVCIYLPLYYSISQAYFLMLDFPGYSVSKLIKQSSNLMKGHKLRLFLLELSFLPLLLLSLFTFGIGLFWVSPYLFVTRAFFFLNLMQAKDTTV